jgi:cytosine/adenosine deaminase-related metal-dependent hydrolase
MADFATGGTILRGGYVLTMDPALGDLERGDVRIVGGVIDAVGPELDSRGLEVIDATDTIVMPGFVDTHRHTWQSALRNIAADWNLGQYMNGLVYGFSKHFRPEDTYIGNLLGSLEALSSGITTLVDWSHNLDTPAHSDAAIDALSESGQRVVFAHGGGASMYEALESHVPHHRDAVRVRTERLSAADGLVTMALALRGPELSTLEVTRTDLQMARELGLRATIHVGNGELGRTRPIARMREAGLLGPDITFVHCSSLADDELAMIADSGASVSVAPDIEVQMGHGWPATGRLLDVGVRPSLSIDSCTSNGGNMFGVMRSTLGTQRGLDNSRLENPNSEQSLRLSCKDVVEFATIEGARACGLDSRIGSLTPGKQADVIMLDAGDIALSPLNNPYGSIAYAAHPGHVKTVLVAGDVVKQNGALVFPKLEEIRKLAVLSRTYLLERVQDDPRLADAHLGGNWKPALVTAYEA